MAKQRTFLEWMPEFSAVTALCGGVLVLAGWLFNVGSLKSISPGLATMKANTAVCFILQGVSLLILAEDRGRILRYLGYACAFATAMVAALTLAEYLCGWNPGIDQVLARDSSLVKGLSYPGRPSPATGLSFLLLAGVLPLLNEPRWRWLADGLALVVLGLSLLALLGYAYGVSSLYQIGPYSTTALHTATIFSILGAGCILTRPQLGVAAVIVRDGPGGAAARRLLPAAILIPGLLGWLRLRGQHAGLYELEFGTALLAASSIACMSLVVWWNSRLLHRTDTIRRAAEEALRKTLADMEDRINERTNELSTANAVLSREIADHSLAESALRASQAQFSGILAIAEDAVISVDEEQRVILFNQGAEKIFGYSAAQILGEPIDRLLPEAARASHRQSITEFAQSGRVTRKMAERGAVRGMRKNGTEFPAEASISKLELDGRKIFTVMLRDITERKRAEQELQASLHQKDVLVKEIHHRVKNNLQVISSLLNLQAGHLGGKSPLEVFRDSQDRVRSMALVHEQMYQSADLSSIVFGDYLHILTRDLFVAYGISPETVSLSISAEDVSFNVDMAVTCGLIVNELVSNALKHAFPGHRGGTIEICLRASGDDTLTLLVKDNGVGFPEHVDFRNTGSLGLQLVNSLAKQLRGTIELNSGNGSEFIVTFPRTPLKKGARNGHR